MSGRRGFPCSVALFHVCHADDVVEFFIYLDWGLQMERGRREGQLCSRQLHMLFFFTL